MNKKRAGSIIAGVGVALAVLAVVAALLTNSSVRTSPDNTTVAAPQAAVPTQSETPPVVTSSVAGQYKDYSAEAVQNTKGTKVLFFYAPWCPQCRELDKSIKAGTIPTNVTIFKIDYDSNQALRQKYGVTIQTTLIKVDDSGTQTAKYVAYDKPTLQALIEHLL